MTTSTQTQPKTSTIKFTCIRKTHAASSQSIGQAVFSEACRLDRDPKVEIVYHHLTSEFEVHVTISNFIDFDAYEIERKSYSEGMDNIVDVLAGTIERGGGTVLSYSTSLSNKFNRIPFRDEVIRDANANA